MAHITHMVLANTFYLDEINFNWIFKSCVHHQGPPLLTWINFNPSRISDHMPSKVWDEITYPFPNFNGCTIRLLRIDK